MSNLNTIYKQKILLFLAIVVNLAIVFFIPIHPDDFSSYHALACGFPSQSINTFHSPCNSYFHQFGPFVYQQSYEYVGVSSSIIMSVLIRFMNPLIAHYIWGFIALVVTAIGLYKSFKIQKHWILIFFYFPLTYSILHDDSPIRISIIFFAWTPFLLIKAKKSKKLLRISIYFFLSMGWLVSTEDKPFFVYLLPGLFFLYLSTQDQQRLKRLSTYWKNLLLYFTLFLPTLFFLLFSKTNGQSYLESLSQNSPITTYGYIRSILTASLHLVSWFAFSVRAVDFNYSPKINQGEYLEAIPWGNGVISIISLIVLLRTITLFIIFYFKIFRNVFSRNKNMNKIKLQILAVFMLLIFPILGGSWSAHHYVFAQIVIMILLFENLDKFPVNKPYRFIATLSALTVLLTSLTPARSYNSNDSRKAIDYAYSIATDKSVINCAYSCYFEYSLRNIRSIPVTFATTPSEGSELVSRHKNIITICKLCQNKDVAILFGSTAKVKHESTFGDWSVFKVS